MFNDLFINLLLLISFTLIIGNILKDISETTKDKLCFKLILGFMGGTLGVLVIFYNIKVMGTPIIIDLRVLALMIIDSVGGIISVIISAIILICYRLLYNGINQASVIAAITIILYVLIFIFINKIIRNYTKQWFIKLFAVLLLSDFILLYLLRNNSIFKEALFTYSLTLIFAGCLEFFLLEYVKQSNEALKMYKENSTKDYLTGLNNTRSFDLLINNAVKNTLEKNESLSCLMIDIDYFKKVNDTYGHASGDIVLRDLAKILVNSCKSYDIVSRVGGEEFCVILLDCSNERAFEIGSKIKNSVEKSDFYIDNNKKIKITVSIGLSTFPDLVEDIDFLKKEADKALYLAKQSGRNRVCNNIKCIF